MMHHRHSQLHDRLQLERHPLTAATAESATSQALQTHSISTSNTTPADTHGLAGVHQAINWTIGNVFLGTIALFAMMALMHRLFDLSRAHARHMQSMGRRNQMYWTYNRSYWLLRIKKHLLYQSFWGERLEGVRFLGRLLRALPQSRCHITILLFYLGSNVAYTLALPWNWTDHAGTVARLRGRSGFLAALNLVLTVLFALRSNPLIRLLHTTLDTFNFFHRWSARIVVLEAVIHTVCWAVNEAASNGLEGLRRSLATNNSYICGMAATFALFIGSILALKPLRRAYYGSFLLTHRCLAVVVLVGTYLHLQKANLPQLPYTQLCIGIWSVEWMWRITNIVYYNFSKKRTATRVTVEALPSQACRVTFHLSRPWRWRPGCHVYAYLPIVSLLSSHPFSIAWAQREHTEYLARTDCARAEYSAQGLDSEHSTTQPTSTDLGQDKPLEFQMTSVSLIIRARSGMTRRLYEKAIRAPFGSISAWGLIEGPYGGFESLRSYGTVVLFAAGIGITHCIGFVPHLLLQHRLGVSSTQRILLVWSVGSDEAYRWVAAYMDIILRMDRVQEVLRVRIFVTRGSTPPASVSKSSIVQIHFGHCSPLEIIEGETKDRIGAIGVTVCGPSGFALDVRNAVRNSIKDEHVDFFAESFS